MHSVQCVIATDGISSFVLNLYDNYQFIFEFLNPNENNIGFYEGQDSPYNVYTAEIVMRLQEKNLYRIDGRLLCFNLDACTYQHREVTSSSCLPKLYNYIVQWWIHGGSKEQEPLFLFTQQ